MKRAPLTFAFVAVLAGCGGSGSELPAQPGAPGPSGGDTPGEVGVPDLGSLAAPSDGGAVTHDLARPPVADMATPPRPTKKVLPFVWQGEQQYYMCGPSAARMALSTRMASPPSQADLASYMGTTSNGTDYVGLVRGALNHYLAISAYAETDLPSDPPSQAQKDALQKQLVASIDAGYGLVANVVSGWRPPFYPQGGTIYHYIALVGYDADGAKVLVADPAATGCGNGECGVSSSEWYNTPKSYWIDTADLAVWITPKGYTYHP